MRDLNEQSGENSILVIDNYDSFTYNIVQYLKIIGVSPLVIKNDELSLNSFPLAESLSLRAGEPPKTLVSACRCLTSIRTECLF